VLVRSVWRADVKLRPWEAHFEIADRRVVAPTAVEDALWLGSHRSAPSSGANSRKPRSRRLAAVAVAMSARAARILSAETPIAGEAR
jgi:hypothetical protein